MITTSPGPPGWLSPPRPVPQPEPTRGARVRRALWRGLLTMLALSLGLLGLGALQAVGAGRGPAGSGGPDPPAPARGAAPLDPAASLLDRGAAGGRATSAVVETTPASAAPTTGPGSPPLRSSTAAARSAAKPLPKPASLPAAGPRSPAGPAPAATDRPATGYANCAAARAAGAAPLHRGDPGHSRSLDRDGDGVAFRAAAGGRTGLFTAE